MRKREKKKRTRNLFVDGGEWEKERKGGKEKRDPLSNLPPGTPDEKMEKEGGTFLTCRTRKKKKKKKRVRTCLSFFSPKRMKKGGARKRRLETAHANKGGGKKRGRESMPGEILLS